MSEPNNESISQLEESNEQLGEVVEETDDAGGEAAIRHEAMDVPINPHEP